MTRLERDLKLMLAMTPLVAPFFAAALVVRLPPRPTHAARLATAPLMLSDDPLDALIHVPLEDLTHDGQPMGFDVSLSSAKGDQRGSVAVELTYNPLDR